MNHTELVFPSGKIKYIADGVVDQEVFGFRSHIFQQTQAKYWSVMFECFAAHYDFLRMSVAQVILDRGDKEAAAKVKKLRPKYAVKHVMNSHDDLLVELDGVVYACFPDTALDEVGELRRSSSSDVSVLNWYCYQCARRSFSQINTQHQKLAKEAKHRWQLESAIDKAERERITEIISKQHVIHYPRPADSRLEYLEANGIGKLALELM